VYGNAAFNAACVHAQFPYQALQQGNLAEMLALASDPDGAEEVVWGDRIDGTWSTREIQACYGGWVYYGHTPYHNFDWFDGTDFTPVPKAKQEPLDSSCGYGGPLTCRILHRRGKRELLQQQNLDILYPIYKIYVSD
jgi:hypothetical protein